MKTEPVEIFQTIRASLQPYSAEGFNVHTNSDTVYEIYTNKAVEMKGKAKDEVYFAGVKILKEEVGFYFMPAADQKEIESMLHPALLQLLKENSCFHIKHLDDALLEQINDVLKAGAVIYKQKGWV